jgi:hypothetical protein
MQFYSFIHSLIFFSNQLQQLMLILILWKLSNEFSANERMKTFDIV